MKLSILTGTQRFRSITRLSNENFSYAIEELPDDGLLGDYDPDKSEFYLDNGYVTQGVGHYTPTHPHGYTFPPLKKPQQPEALRPKEDALVVAKVVLSKFPKENVDAYKESQEAKDLLLKKRDLDEYAKSFHNPNISSFPVSALKPKGVLYRKAGFLIQNIVKKSILTQIRAGNKHTCLTSKMEEVVLES